MARKLEGKFRLVPQEEVDNQRYVGRDSNELVSSTFDKPSVGNRYEGSDADMDDLFYKNEDNISAIKKWCITCQNKFFTFFLC